MAVFTDQEIRENFYVWQMFRDGSVSLIHRANVFRKIVSDMDNLGYTILEIDCQFEDERELEHALRRVLHLEDGFGLDAFNSQLWDLEFPDCTGMVIALTNISEFNRQFKKYLWDVIDILVRESRIRMLQGQRLLVMLYSTDNNIDFEPVGSIRVTECLLKSVPDIDAANGG